MDGQKNKIKESEVASAEIFWMVTYGRKPRQRSGALEEKHLLMQAKVESRKCVEI